VLKKPVQIVAPKICHVTRLDGSGTIVFQTKKGDAPPIVATFNVEVTGGTAKQRESIARSLDMIGERVVAGVAAAWEAQAKEATK